MSENLQVNRLADNAKQEFMGFFGEEPTTTPDDINEESKTVYFNLIKDMYKICDAFRYNNNEADATHILPSVNRIIELLQKDEKMLMSLANAPYTYVLRQTGIPDNFASLVIHGVNVMIYSLRISIELAVPKNRIPYIAIAALFYPIGFLDVIKGNTTENISDNSVQEYEKLSSKYFENIKIENFHVESIKFLISLASDDEQILGTTSLNEAMYQYAVVIHVCNEFDKLTHQQTYGEVFAPVDAMKKIKQKMNDYFNQDIIKLFFNKLSIYPLGSFVLLSSNETAKIVGLNDNFIMRPVVLVVLDSEGREKLPPVRINLRQKPNIYIKKPVINDFLTEKFIDVF